MYSSCFCYAKSTLFNIDPRLDFCRGGGGKLGSGDIGLALAWGKERGYSYRTSLNGASNLD